MDPPPPGQSALDSWKLAVLQAAGKVLRQVLFWLALAAQLAAVLRAGQLIWQRRLTFPFVLAVAAWGACASTILLGALVHVTSFPSMSVTYLDSAYPMLLLFVIAAFWDVGGDWRSFRRQPAAPGSAPADGPAA